MAKNNKRKEAYDNLKYTLNMILVLNINDNLAKYLQMSSLPIDRHQETEMKYNLLQDYRYLYTADEYTELFNAIFEQKQLIQSRDEVLDLLSQDLNEETKPKNLLKLLSNYVANENEEIAFKTYILECNIMEFDEVEYKHLSTEIFNSCSKKEPHVLQKKMRI